jgi:hypothetical protein
MQLGECYTAQHVCDEAAGIASTVSSVVHLQAEELGLFALGVL